MNAKVAAYLSHPENRINICQANSTLWTAKGDNWLAQLARTDLYRWVGLAQDNHLEDHF